jgi:hypothetical protein
MKRALFLAVLVACSSTPAERAASRGLPEQPVALDLGREPLVNPLNLWEMMIEGSPDHETVGTIGTRRVTTRELDDTSDQLLTRIGDRIYLARDRGWRALLERDGLTRAAAAAHQDLVAFLAAQYRTLPQPTKDDLARMAAHPDLAELAPAERTDAARSLWREQRWLVLRSLLVDEGLRGVLRERLQLMLVNPAFAPPTTSIGKIGDHVVTRAELHLAAGYAEQLARKEYFDAARTQFERFANDTLLADAAKTAGVTPDELVARARAKLGPPPDAEVTQFIAENPAYASEHERAVDAVRTLREVGARDALVAELATKAGGVHFLLREPTFDRIPVGMLAPRHWGLPSARPLIEVMHCVGGPTCAQGMELLSTLMYRFGSRARFEVGDYWSGVDATRLRHAIALRCADEQRSKNSFALFDVLRDHTERATTPQLLAAAHRVARFISFDEKRFRACLADDRHIDQITEDRLRAEQLGLELDIVGIWVDGWRIDNVGNALHVTGVVQQRLGGAAP